MSLYKKPEKSSLLIHFRPSQNYYKNLTQRQSLLDLKPVMVCVVLNFAHCSGNVSSFPFQNELKLICFLMPKLSSLWHLANLSVLWFRTWKLRKCWNFKNTCKNSKKPEIWLNLWLTSIVFPQNKQRTNSTFTKVFVIFVISSQKDNFG